MHRIWTLTGASRAAAQATTSVVLATMLCAAAIALLPAGVLASEGGPDSFVLAPASGQSSAAKGYFVLGLKPGESSRQHLIVRNDADRKLTVELASVDTSTTPTGGVGYQLSGQPLTGTGAWLTLSERRVELAPGEQRPVDVNVTVPSDALPGDYVAGISAMVPVTAPTPSASSDGGEASVQMTVQTRRVIAVQVAVPGDAAPRLEIAGVKPVPGSGGMGLAILISNDGGKFTSGTGTIEVPSTSLAQDFSFGLVVPHTSFEYPIAQWQTAPKAGKYPAHVVVKYGEEGALTAEWSGDITVVGEAVSELEGQYVPPEQAAVLPASGPPWPLYGAVGVLIVVVIVMGFLLIRRRRPEVGGRPR